MIFLIATIQSLPGSRMWLTQQVQLAKEFLHCPPGPGASFLLLFPKKEKTTTRLLEHNQQFWRDGFTLLSLVPYFEDIMNAFKLFGIKIRELFEHGITCRSARKKAIPAEEILRPLTQWQPIKRTTGIMVSKQNKFKVLGTFLKV